MGTVCGHCVWRYNDHSLINALIRLLVVDDDEYADDDVLFWLVGGGAWFLPLPLLPVAVPRPAATPGSHALAIHQRKSVYTGIPLWSR